MDPYQHADGWAGKIKPGSSSTTANVEVEIEEQPKPKPKEWIKPADRALRLGGIGKRVKTGFATFDQATRGGIPVGKLIVVGGAPGAGKTTWTTQLGWSFARAGYHVTLLACDEDADGLLIRIGQAEGLSRDDLEAANEAARRDLADTLTGVATFALVDADEEDALVEEASAELRARANGAPAVLIVDSIQTARVAGTAEAKSVRERIDLVMYTLKQCAKANGQIIIATCELARGAYRSQNAAERIDDLAAFKESGGIEYGATTAMVLRSVADVPGAVNVTIPKNRLGQKLAFRMQLDHASATFREVEMPTEEDDASKPSPMQLAKEKIMDVVAKSVTPINSASELARRAKLGKATALRAVKELAEDGRLERQGSGGYLAVPGGSGRVF